MSASTTTMTSAAHPWIVLLPKISWAGVTSMRSGTTPAFWERLWRTAGIQSVLGFIVAYFVYGNQPQVGASADALTAFYGGSGARILIAAVFYGLAVLNLMWFSAAVRPAASEDTLNFCVLTGVRPMIETYPLDRAAEAYSRMLSRKAEFRVVLTM